MSLLLDAGRRRRGAHRGTNVAVLTTTGQMGLAGTARAGGRFRRHIAEEGDGGHIRTPSSLPMRLPLRLPMLSWVSRVASWVVIMKTVL